jgi:CRP/FNR family transcriptional regulator, anaerobic regulatory protein
MFSAPQVREPASSKSYKGTSVVPAYRESQNDGFERGTIRRVEAKEHVFCEGDPRTHVFRIEEGVIALSKLLSDGRRQVIDFAYPGDYIGLGILNDHIFDAQATCAAKIRCLPASALEQAAALDASLALKLYKAVSAELLAARSLLVSVGQGTAMERLASFLLGLHHRSMDNSDVDVVNLPMRRSDIADLLGLTIETVSRTITKLRSLRVIDVVHGTEVRILDCDRLEELAG